MRSFKARKQAGFTLIELIIVIVIIGILAAVAIPKFQEYAQEAKINAAQSLAGAAASASATNYAVRSGNSSKGNILTSCDSPNWSNLVDLSQGAVIAGAGTCGSTSGTVMSCNLTYQEVVATFNAYCSTATGQ